jgi:hypothetical protein
MRISETMRKCGEPVFGKTQGFHAPPNFGSIAMGGTEAWRKPVRLLEGRPEPALGGGRDVA